MNLVKGKPTFRDEGDLCTTICELLEDLKGDLECGNMNTAFWADAKNEKLKTEIECQTILWPLVRQKIQAFRLPVVANDETHVGPDRCDLSVQHPSPDLPPLTVPAELKMAPSSKGAAWLVDPIETQLWETYMRPLRVQHGIFIVLWTGTSPAFPTIPDLQAAHAQVIKRLKQTQNIHIKSIVIDLTRRS